MRKLKPCSQTRVSLRVVASRTDWIPFVTFYSCAVYTLVRFREGYG